MTQRTWIRNPLAVFTANDFNAGGGLMAEHRELAAALVAR